MTLPPPISVVAPATAAVAPPQIPFYKKPIVIAGGILAVGTALVILMNKET
jgi:hypothetical protein